ncbi:MAG: DUF3052 domain-containing protein [Vicinamibacterales bacterium]
MSPERSYAHRPTFAKLGIKPGFRVCVLGSPRGFTASLAAPADVAFTAKTVPRPDLILCFVSSRSQLAARLAILPGAVGERTCWLIWPKKASGVTTDLDGNIVREAGLAAGLVDYKVCSVDATWSGLAFKRRRGS